jgi:glycerol-3-phosphate acyltransferase PlsX
VPEALSRLRRAGAHQVVAATEVVTMDDPIEVALRRKRDSSMRVAIQQVKDGAAQACVSAGNTGALMAVARYLLKTLDGIDRPAIAADAQPEGRFTTVLDLGANVDCTPEHLLQFAVMGSALVSVRRRQAATHVGLLNIGEEAIKGSESHQARRRTAARGGRRGRPQLRRQRRGQRHLQGHHRHRGVCDGFVGNVMLKTIRRAGLDARRTSSARSSRATC